MKIIHDIAYTDNFDLKVEHGDLVLEESTAQHQKCLLLAGKGDYKQSPTVGVDLFHEIDDERPQELMREVRLEFSKDGMNINKLKSKPGPSGKVDIETEAYYED